MNTIEQTLEKVGLSPAERTIYHALLSGASSVKEIMKESGQKRPTVYYCLNSLLSLGLVSKTGIDYGGLYKLEPLEKLVLLVEGRIESEKKLLGNVKALDMLFQKKLGKKKRFAVSYYDTDQAVREAVMYSAYAKEKLIRSIVPGANFFHDTGIDFVLRYVNEKNARSVKTKALWEDIPLKRVMDTYYDAHSSIRQLPLGMHNEFETTIFIYDNKTLYIGPKKEHYAILIESEDHARCMKALFENTWKGGIEIKKKIAGLQPD